MGGGGKGGSQTIGYKYYMSILMGLGRGSMSEIVEIKVGDKTAWRGPECRRGNDAVFRIEAPDLFGGDEKEGGIYGPCQVLWGDPDQVLPPAKMIGNFLVPSIKEIISPWAPMPALRGVTCLWYDGEITSINPYPKEWKVRARRHIHGWYGGKPWYPAKDIIYLDGPEVVTYKRASQSPISSIFEKFLEAGGSKSLAVKMVLPGNIKAKNGAHIIYECVTNPEWGRGLTPDLIDENSFIYAANQLCAEGFGLCFFWQRQEDVDTFIQTVVDHIGGVLYPDRETGLLTLRLIRDDYDADDLPTFEPGRGLLEILKDDSGSSDTAYNEVVVKYRDPVTNTDGEARAHNVGARIAQGSTNSLTKEYPGIPTAELAGRVAVRDLIAQSGLKKYKVRLDRSGWRIAPGMPFRIKCPQRGIASIVLRAGEVIDSSSQAGGDIQITALEDVFSMPQTAMVVPEIGTWAPPVTDPVTPDASRAFELTYYDMTKHMSQYDLPNINDNDAYVGLMASQPVNSQLQYDLMVSQDDGAAYTNNGTFSFTGNAQLSASVGYLDTVIHLTNLEQWPADIIGDSAMIGNERIRIDAWDPTTNTITVARGVADTLPEQHGVGAYLWLPDDDISSDRTIYAPGESVTMAAATRTSSGLLAAEDYDPQDITVMGRIGAPYPPADLKVNGTSIYEVTGQQGDVVLTWASRNRVLQNDQLVGHTEAAVAAEEGTTYEVEIKDKDGELLATYALGDVDTFTYGPTERAADGSPSVVQINVRAVRGGFKSIARYDLPVVLSGGYGYGYGLNYGGK